MTTRKSRIYFMGFLILAFLLITCGSFAETSSFSRFAYPEYSKKISMDFKDADLRSVLKIFSQQSGMNFIAASDTANTKVTLFFENVPVEEALERILDANDLIYEIQPESDIFTVKKVMRPTSQVITRVYALKHATVSKSKLLTTLDGSDSSSGNNSSSSSSSSTSGTDSKEDEDEVKEGVIAAIRSMLTPQGKIIEDPRTNSLIITDLPSQFPAIEKTIARLDVPVPQVLIEVEMLDISKNTSDQLGVKYGTKVTFSGAQRDVLYPFNQNQILRKGFEFADPEYRVGTVDASGLTMMLQFIKTKTDTKNLANPKILTLNNQSAEIKISTNEAVGIITSNTGGSSITEETIEAERVQTGIFLTVTPQVNIETGEITMAIVPKVIDAQDGGTFDGQTFKDPEERTSKTILRVKDNETIFLGGLKKNNETTTITKVPLLGDIPLIGGAFRYKDKSVEERELVIFITPKIVDDQDHVTPKTINDALTAREQSFPEAKRREIEKALLYTEQQRLKK